MLVVLLEAVGVVRVRVGVERHQPGRPRGLRVRPVRPELPRVRRRPRRHDAGLEGRHARLELPEQVGVVVVRQRLLREEGLRGVGHVVAGGVRAVLLVVGRLVHRLRGRVHPLGGALVAVTPRGTPARPVLVLGGPVPLPPVLEPVGHLRGGQPRGLGQLALLARRGVGVVLVPVPQHGPRLLLEAVAGLLAVPDGPRQGELAPHAVLAHGAEGPAPELLRLDVVRLEPERLQLGVVVRRELVALQQPVQVIF